MAHDAQGVAQLLLRWPATQAVVCLSDHAAFGALMEAQRRGWAVPQRLAIAGFGGFEVSTACHPHLTTVAVDCFGIGQAAGRRLLRACEAARSGRRAAAGARGGADPVPRGDARQHLKRQQAFTRPENLGPGDAAAPMHRFNGSGASAEPSRAVAFRA